MKGETNMMFKETESKRLIRLVINGESYEVAVEPHKLLVEVLREDLGLTGTKYACGLGECGSCTVLVEGKPILSCLTLAVAVDGKNIVTIEGLTEKGRLHPIQEEFVNHGAIQCGYCTPGMVLMAKALLDENSDPTEEEVKEYIKGNLCRCTGYVKIVEAILEAAKRLKEAR